MITSTHQPSEDPTARPPRDREIVVPKRSRRFAREPKTPAVIDQTIDVTSSVRAAPSTPRKVRAALPDGASIRRPRAPSRLDELQALLVRAGGASLADMTGVTCWQPHSVRGAMAGALRKRGLVITSSKVEGVRRWHATAQAA